MNSSIPNAGPNRNLRHRKFRWLVVLCVGVVGCWWYWQSQNRQSQRDDQASAYSAPKTSPPLATPIPAPAELAKSDRRAPENAAALNGGAHPLDPVLLLAEQVRDRIQSEVVDYTATVVKRERIKGKLGKAEHMEVKIRNPNASADLPQKLSVYIKFIAPSANAGREVLWVDGRDDGQLHSYQFGIPVSLQPTSSLAMMGNKYPITEIGILRLAEKLIEKGQRDRLLGSCRVEIFENEIIEGRSCKLIQVTHDNRHAQFDFHIAQVYIDNELQVPIRYAAYLWPESSDAAPLLEEEYTYSNLRLNVGLEDIDFDRENPAYHFP